MQLCLNSFSTYVPFSWHIDFLQNMIFNMQIVSLLHSIFVQGNVYCTLFHVLMYFFQIVEFRGTKEGWEDGETELC